MNSFYEEAGKRIRLLREERNLSRDILSERAEISAKFLYEIESGKKGFSADTLYRLSKALNVPSEYILSGNCSINDISEYTQSKTIQHRAGDVLTSNYSINLQIML